MRQLRASARYLSVFCRELYQLVRSGIPMGEGLDMLRRDETDKEVRAWLDALCQSVEEGMPLSAALRETGAFPAYMTDMVSLAEETGRLQDVLLALARHYDRQLRLAADLRGALTAPLAMFTVMVAVIVLLVTQVLPVFDRVFAQLGVGMGALAATLMYAGAVLARASTGIGIALVVLAAAGILVAAAPSLRRRFAAWCKSRFGGRGVMGQLAAARFASAMAMAVSSGMAMEDAVDLAGKLCAGARELDEKVDLCRRRIREGGSPADALAECGLFGGRDCRMLKLAEQTGSLPDTLEDLARRQEEEGLGRLDRLVGAIEPTVVVVTSLLAGVILVSVMLPLMGLLSTIG